jgi:hypothetical protein
LLLTLGTAAVIASSTVHTDPLTQAVAAVYAVPVAVKRSHGVPVREKNPWSAVFLSLGTPMAMGLLASVPVFPVGFQPMAILGVLAPAGVVAGYLYAGDPRRGFWVGLGSYGASVS